MKIASAILGLLLAAAAPVFAQQHHHSKPVASGSPSIRFVDATLQTTKSGTQATSTWKFIAVWTSTTPPTTFFWRPEGERWMGCAVSRVRGFVSQDKTPFYKKQIIDLKDIRKGDMIELVPLAMGRNIMPPEVKAKAAGLIYFERTGKGWETANPGAIHKITDIVMP